MVRNTRSSRAPEDVGITTLAIQPPKLKIEIGDKEVPKAIPPAKKCTEPEICTENIEEQVNTKAKRKRSPLIDDTNKSVDDQTAEQDSKSNVDISNQSSVPKNGLGLVFNTGQDHWDFNKQLCKTLEALIPAEELKSARKKKEIPLRDKLHLSWNGMTYEERVESMTAEANPDLKPVPDPPALPAYQPFDEARRFKAKPRLKCASEDNGGASTRASAAAASGAAQKKAGTPAKGAARGKAAAGGRGRPGPAAKSVARRNADEAAEDEDTSSGSGDGMEANARTPAAKKKPRSRAVRASCRKGAAAAKTQTRGGDLKTTTALHCNNPHEGGASPPLEDPVCQEDLGLALPGSSAGAAPPVVGLKTRTGGSGEGVPADPQDLASTRSAIADVSLKSNNDGKNKGVATRKPRSAKDYDSRLLSDLDSDDDNMGISLALPSSLAAMGGMASPLFGAGRAFPNPIPQPSSTRKKNQSRRKSMQSALAAMSVAGYREVEEELEEPPSAVVAGRRTRMAAAAAAVAVPTITVAGRHATRGGTATSVDEQGPLLGISSKPKDAALGHVGTKPQEAHPTPEAPVSLLIPPANSGTASHDSVSYDMEFSPAPDDDPADMAVDAFMYPESPQAWSPTTDADTQPEPEALLFQPDAGGHGQPPGCGIQEGTTVTDRQDEAEAAPGTRRGRSKAKTPAPPPAGGKITKKKKQAAEPAPEESGSRLATGKGSPEEAPEPSRTGPVPESMDPVYDSFHDERRNEAWLLREGTPDGDVGGGGIEKPGEDRVRLEVALAAEKLRNRRLEEELAAALRAKEELARALADALKDKATKQSEVESRNQELRKLRQHVQEVFKVLDV